MKSLIQLIVLLSFGLIGLTANAVPVTLDYSDAYYLGAVVPDQPANEADEAEFINDLIDLAAGDWATCGAVNPTRDRICDRTGSTLDAVFPDVTATGAVKDDTPVATGIDVTGFNYVLGKYGQDALVWYIGGQGFTELNIISAWEPPAGCDYGDSTGKCPKGGGLSHWTLFNFDGHMEVPEPGTLGLLGLGLLALSLGRRRLS